MAGLGLLALGVLVMDSGGCGLSTEGASGACIDDLDCADNNPCNVETCGDDKKCTSTPVPDGPALNQIPGDCQQTSCEAGQAIQTEDETDKDDGNPCTADSCDSGVPEHDPDPLDNQACLMGGTCNEGTCVIVCDETADCDDGEPCTIDSCDLSTQECFYQGNHGALVDNVNPTDCIQVVCNDKVQVVVADDGEVPDDMNVCTNDRCEAGTAYHDPLEGNPCAAGVCNANGQCVGCNSPNDCEGTDNECQHRTCVNEICGTAYEPEGTLTSNQSGGDCKREVCDGNGGTYQAADSGDPPGDDGNPCTSQTCSGSNPSFPPCCMDSPCPSGVCNGTGLCVQCNSPGQCADPGTCSAPTCNSNACGVMHYGAGTDPENACADQGAQSCGTNGSCNGSGGCALYPNGTVCQGASCSGNQQTTQKTCNGSGSCNQGGSTSPCYPYVCGATACKTSCANDGDCQSPNTCSGGVCKFPNGTACPGGNGDCHSNMCVDGYCCNSSCATVCFDCNVPGNLGTCTPNPAGTDDGTCMGATESCDGAGACKLENGQACTMTDGSQCFSGNCVDGFCCDMPCTGLCKACSAAKTDAGNGVCANVTACSDPDNECNGGGGSHECQSDATCGPGC